MITCQHCGTEAMGRTMCPSCKRRMQPRDAQPMTLALADMPPPAPMAVDPEPRAHCSSCGRSPVEFVSLNFVESYVVFYRWHKRTGIWCRDCALDAFRAAQYRSLTRGWWGLLLGPIANVIAIMRNFATWRRLRRMPAPRQPRHAAPARPVTRRASAYLTTTAAVVVAALAVSAFAHSQANPSAQAITSQLQAALNPAPVTPAGLTPYTGPLKRLAPQLPLGWVDDGDLNLTIAKVASTYIHPSVVRSDLRQLDYTDGLDTYVYKPTPRVTVEEELLRFRTSDDADGWLLRYLTSNQPSTHRVFRASFNIDGDHLKQGFLASARDEHGFSYGIAVAQVDNVMIHVRVATISTLTSKELSRYLDRAWSAAEQGLSIAG